ncbi:MAG TPA: hypothetical protein VLE53_03885 [Gemmatimonadaceae bacterium]|nr:hypothetical protein [Gemmatimonadaceae bacterium]
MAGFFPTKTSDHKAITPESFRHVSLSLVEMAVLTGVVARLYRALVLSRADGGDFLYLALTFAVFLALLLGLATLHLGNFPIRHWLWRAPTFAVIEAAAESLVSVVLIAVGREFMGTLHATMSDWPGLVARTFVLRVTLICAFAFVLAMVVQLARYLLLRRAHRQHTLETVQR